MLKIGVLSDTHGYLDEKLLDFFKDCQEIWHAGDIGDPGVIEKLGKHKPVIAVYGNIDGNDIRIRFPENQRLIRDGLDIWMTHIGGYPGNYDRRIKQAIMENPPGIFISGHSHILKVMHDKSLGTLHINPGAAGFHGLHKVRTAVRFNIDTGTVRDLEVIELGPRSIKRSSAND